MFLSNFPRYLLELVNRSHILVELVVFKICIHLNNCANVNYFGVVYFTVMISLSFYFTQWATVGIKPTAILLDHSFV